jgi:hypothetical protein
VKRYEVREVERTQYQQQFDSGSVFIVWDTERDMRVSFGSYRTREQAERRIKRMEER